MVGQALPPLLLLLALWLQALLLAHLPHWPHQLALLLLALLLALPHWPHQLCL